MKKNISETAEDSEYESTDSGKKKKKADCRGQHTCRLCDLVFKRRYDYDLHNRKIHDKHENMCDVCGKGFLQRSDLIWHRKIHTCTKDYSCEYCARRFDRPAGWKFHVERKHKDKGNFDFCCWRCKEEFEDSEALVSHMSVHRVTLIYECHICFKKFDNQNDLSDHVKNKHEIERSHVCIDCGGAYPNQCRLRYHTLQGCVSAVRKYICRSCPKVHPNQLRLDRHNMSRHIGFSEEELWNAMRVARMERSFPGAVDIILPEVSDKLVVLWTNRFDDDFKAARVKLNCEDLIVCTFDTVWDDKYLKLLSKCIDFDSTLVTIRLAKSHAHFIRVFTFGTQTIPDGWRNRAFSTYRNFEKRLSRRAKENGKTLYHIVSSDKKNIFTKQCAASLRYSTVFAI